ncbi:DotU family type IV/VI secretion system protein [Pseudomonas sp. NPDC086278]|uniref:DotU family type IV/VI secretion system protein n=1 Tax=Pseudomonas sp. NPDC086278 TaxID=3390646 RepID=UPI003D02C6D4
MTPTRLADCWMPVFDAAKHGFADTTQTHASLSTALMGLVDGAVARARNFQFAEAEIREAQFAVVAWIDETAMSGQWAGAMQWRTALLQNHYFSTSRAGVEFFQRLEALPESAVGAREVYGLALLAGFQGRFATRPVGELSLYRQKCIERIALDNRMTGLDSTTPLFTQPTEIVPRAAKTIRRGLPGVALVMLIGIPLVILCVLYVTFDQSLSQQVNQLLEVR